MKQLLLLSGKGGTGKTTLASAFIELAKARAAADCDVDAPNLHLVMQRPSPARTQDYLGLPKAHIDQEVCTRCGACQEHCRFAAIRCQDTYQVDPYQCEGCGVCAVICPVQAVTMVSSVSGEVKLYTDPTVFATAQLRMGSGASGKLVTEVKWQMVKATSDEELAIIDGSPGIGCPIIASIAGVDLVLVVTEPSVAAIHDLDRIVQTIDAFSVLRAVCINRSDTNQQQTAAIERYCQDLGIPMVGHIPFCPHAGPRADQGLSITSDDCAAAQAVRDVFRRTLVLLKESGYSNAGICDVERMEETP